MFPSLHFFPPAELQKTSEEKTDTESHLLYCITQYRVIDCICVRAVVVMTRS